MKASKTDNDRAQRSCWTIGYNYVNSNNVYWLIECYKTIEKSDLHIKRHSW